MDTRETMRLRGSLSITLVLVFSALSLYMGAMTRSLVLTHHHIKDQLELLSSSALGEGMVLSLGADSVDAIPQSNSLPQAYSNFTRGTKVVLFEGEAYLHRIGTVPHILLKSPKGVKWSQPLP